MTFFANPVTAGGGGGGTALADLAQGATAGSVIFSDGANGLAEDNDSFFWDNSAKRLGIGTAAPSAHLEVTPDAVKSDETPEPIFQLTEKAHTSLSDAEYPAVVFDLSADVEFDGASDFDDQRAFKILAPTYSAEAAHTITRAATVYIDKAPQAGTNVTLTDSYALWVDSGDVRIDGQIFLPEDTGSDFNETAPVIASVVDPQTGIYFGSGAVESFNVAINGQQAFTVGSGGDVVFVNDIVDDVRPSHSSITLGGGTRWGTTSLQATDIEGDGGKKSYLLKLSWKTNEALSPSSEFHQVHFDFDVNIEGTNGHNFQDSVTNVRAFRIDKPPYQGHGGDTITNAATVYIEGAADIKAGNLTITNNYALWVDAGLNRFDGDGTHVFELPADATDPTGGGGAATGRIPVTIGGATRYLAYY